MNMHLLDTFLDIWWHFCLCKYLPRERERQADKERQKEIETERDRDRDRDRQQKIQEHY